MEDRRAQTLEALETFINSQKAILARTHADLARLQGLKNDAIANPTSFLQNVHQEIKERSLHLGDAQLLVPREIDWALYDGHDPGALQNLNIDLRQKREQRNRPHPHQRSELSPLQKFVKEARRNIVDPVLAIYEGMSEPEDEPEEKLDPEEARRQLEKAKLRELKKHKIHTYGGLSLPSRGTSGVYIRHDVEDESLDVDITLDDRSSSAMDVDTPSSSTPVLHPPPLKRLPAPSMPRAVKLTPKAQSARNLKASVIKKQKVNRPPSERGSSPEVTVSASSKSKRGNDKPKPETYKQQWSMSEQHLLEQLLDQIPEGEKNRWQKISIAMEGKRTPRQVASRVQKYFAKLKRFGI